jgi:hypothetical protein
VEQQLQSGFDGTGALPNTPLKKVTTSQNENRERRPGGEGAVAGPEGGIGGNGPGWGVLRSRNRLNAVRQPVRPTACLDGLQALVGLILAGLIGCPAVH